MADTRTNIGKSKNEYFDLIIKNISILAGSTVSCHLLVKNLYLKPPNKELINKTLSAILPPILIQDFMWTLRNLDGNQSNTRKMLTK